MATSLGIFLDTILGSVTSSIYGLMYPYGGYSGSKNQVISYTSDPIITNPWSVPATFIDSSKMSNMRSEGITKTWGINLKPGQSYNFQTGTYNDPTLHQLTAQRLNDQMNRMRVNEAGIDPQVTSARQQKSVLATVDELFWGDVRTSARSTELSLQKQAEQGGFNMSEKRTILGDRKRVK